MFLVLLCGIFLGELSQAHQETGNGEKFVKNLLHEVGTNTQQIIEKKIYNETEGIEICWTNVVYVNETSIEDALESWEEIQITFHFPAGAGDESPQNESSKQYKQYSVSSSGGKAIARDFEVIEEHANFTISKLENVTCAKGQFLSKTYQEWPATDQKKIILRLSDVYSGLKYDRDEIVGIKNDKGKEIIVGSTREEHFDSSEEMIFSDEKNDTLIDDDDSEPAFTSFKATKKGENKITGIEKEEVERDLSSILRSGGSTNLNNTIAKDKKGLPSVDSCSPMLTQLLSGNGILSGLCNMKKDDKLILRGDIIISKKYFNETNRKEMEKPLYIIHENSEIEATK